MNPTSRPLEKLIRKGIIKSVVSVSNQRAVRFSILLNISIRPPSSSDPETRQGIQSAGFPSTFNLPRRFPKVISAERPVESSSSMLQIALGTRTSGFVEKADLENHLSFRYPVKSAFDFPAGHSRSVLKSLNTKDPINVANSCPKYPGSLVKGWSFDLETR